MNWAIAIALVTIAGCLIAMFHSLRRGATPSRRLLYGAFATMNLGAAVLVGAIMSGGALSTSLQLLLVLVSVAFFIGEIRASRLDRRESGPTR